MKVAINTCFGGFGLSIEAVDLYAKKAGFEVYHYVSDYSNGYNNKKNKRYDGSDKYLCFFHLKEDIGDEPSDEELNNAEWFDKIELERNDPILIEVIEELGDKANGMCANLTVVEIPDDVDYIIEEYDGNEHIAESHRTWYA